MKPFNKFQSNENVFYMVYCPCFPNRKLNAEHTLHKFILKNKVRNEHSKHSLSYVTTNYCICVGAFANTSAIALLRFCIADSDPCNSAPEQPSPTESTAWPKLI